jgi:hypothetical protein
MIHQWLAKFELLPCGQFGLGWRAKELRILVSYAGSRFDRTIICIYSHSKFLVLLSIFIAEQLTGKPVHLYMSFMGCSSLQPLNNGESMERRIKSYAGS